MVKFEKTVFRKRKKSKKPVKSRVPKNLRFYECQKMKFSGKSKFSGKFLGKAKSISPQVKKWRKKNAQEEF